MIEILLSISIIVLFFIWVEIITLKHSHKNKKEIKCEDKYFIWILKNEKWVRYNKIKDEWIVMSSPPF